MTVIDIAESEQDLTSPISRALHLLDVIASANGPVRFVDVQKLSPLPKATLSRLLRQLEAEGMLIFDTENQRYRLGLRLIRMAHSAWESASLVEAAGPIIDRLARELGTTIHLACLESAQVLYLDKRTPVPTIRMFSSPGRIGPAYCTGVGKAMLAFLPPERQREAIAKQSFYKHTEHTLTDAAALTARLEKIRAEGFARDEEEHEPTVICVAVPIIGANGNVLGAISSTSTTHITDLPTLEHNVPALQTAARTIARTADVQMLGNR